MKQKLLPVWRVPVFLAFLLCLSGSLLAQTQMRPAQVQQRQTQYQDAGYQWNGPGTTPELIQPAKPTQNAPAAPSIILPGNVEVSQHPFDPAGKQAWIESHRVQAAQMGAQNAIPEFQTSADKQAWMQQHHSEIAQLNGLTNSPGNQTPPASSLHIISQQEFQSMPADKQTHILSHPELYIIQ